MTYALGINLNYFQLNSVTIQKLRNMDTDFKRPMAYQPEVLNIKSKEDIWKNELGLDGIE